MNGSVATLANDNNYKNNEASFKNSVSVKIDRRNIARMRKIHFCFA